MECGHPGISCFRGVKEFSGGGQNAKKIKNTMQLVIREEPNLRLQFFEKSMDTVTPEVLDDEVSQSFLEVVTCAPKLVNAVQIVSGLSCHWKHTAR